MDIGTEIRDEVRAWATPAGRSAMMLGFVVLGPLWGLASLFTWLGATLDRWVKTAARWIVDRAIAF